MSGSLRCCNKLLQSFKVIDKGHNSDEESMQVYGIGLVPSSKQIFVTMNGKLVYDKMDHLKYWHSPLLMNLFPSFTFNSREESLKINFGLDMINQPFRFDLASFVN